VEGIESVGPEGGAIFTCHMSCVLYEIRSSHGDEVTSCSLVYRYQGLGGTS
jgi:hypothetical protein